MKNLVLVLKWCFCFLRDIDEGEEERMSDDTNIGGGLLYLVEVKDIWELLSSLWKS